eukprot:1159770-Pelagomonas_calceolata.AAC.9
MAHDTHQGGRPNGGWKGWMMHSINMHGLEWKLGNMRVSVLGRPFKQLPGRPDKHKPGCNDDW